MLGKRPRFVPFQQEEQRLGGDSCSLLLSNSKNQSSFSSPSPSPSPSSSSFVHRQVFGFEIAASKEASEWLQNSVTEVSSSSASNRRSSHGGIAAALLSNQNGSNRSFIPAEAIANTLPSSSLFPLPDLPPPPLQQTEKILTLTLAIRNPRSSPDFRDGRIIAKTEGVDGKNGSFIPAEAIAATPSLHPLQQTEKTVTLNPRDNRIAKTTEEGDEMNESFIPAEAIASPPSVPPLQQAEKTLTPNPRYGRIAKTTEAEGDGMAGSFVPAEAIAAASPLQKMEKTIAVWNPRCPMGLRDGWIIAKTMMGDRKGEGEEDGEEEEKMEIFPRKNSIFIAAPASPPESISDGTGNGECCFCLSIDFMKACFFCSQALTGKDVYMYRGDRAFCSVECRYQQIIIDERNERCSSLPRTANRSYSKGRALATPTASAA